MIVIFSDNYRLSIPADTATIMCANKLVTTFNASSQPAASVKIYWSHKVMSLPIILKHLTLIHF